MRTASTTADLDRSDADEERPSRYVVGIDLGTTNCALAMVDTERHPDRIDTFAIPQLVDAGLVESLETLPSFLYLPATGEFDERALHLPWKSGSPGFVGRFARDHGAQVSGRTVSSAKSWLCHAQVDRTARLLPWQGAADLQPVSPVEASAAYLQHLRHAWDQAHRDAPLAEQDLVLTLPASFDEIARELTVEAAHQAGLRRVVLIEEPQAAFYSWIDRHRQRWSEIVRPGQVVLVCDVGGGTTDFTLIHARPDAADGTRVAFHRIAVGDHLILGGDNLDLALAKHLEAKLGSTPLSARAWDVLLRRCRAVKEEMLGETGPDSLGIHLPGSGAKLLGGGLLVEVTRDEAERVLLDGFFPLVSPSERPVEGASGFREFGLPYAADPRVTTYLGEFLRRAARGQEAIPAEPTTGMIRPDWLLFNGGVFDSPRIRRRIVEQLELWFGKGPAESRSVASDSGNDGSAAWSLGQLEHDRLDLAVARGAAYYGMVRRGHGVRIAAGLARAYYVGLAGSPPRAVCLVPAGTEPGPEVELEREFRLRVGTPIELPIYVSATRTNDSVGAVIDVDPQQLRSLVPIRTVLKVRSGAGVDDVVPARLHARLTEIGTLELGCRQTGDDRSWRLQFDVRSAVRTDLEAHEGSGETFGFLDESVWASVQAVLQGTFGPDGTDDPEALMRRLADAIGEAKEQWSPSTLRRLWQSAFELQDGRRRSAKHEARWLNLVGYALRPGFGMALDDWRVAETWKLLQGKLIHGAAATKTESWILWRRIAGGLPAGQQQALAGPLLTQLRQFHRQSTTGRGQAASVDFGSHEAAEIWRLLGSLERLPVPQKVELGRWLIDLRDRKKVQATRGGIVWSLGRLGGRVPLYGLLNHVVPRDEAARWLDALIAESPRETGDLLTVMQLARRCDDRYRDLDDDHRTRALEWLRSGGADDGLLRLVADGGRLASEQQAQLLGDSLPLGLSLE